MYRKFMMLFSGVVLALTTGPIDARYDRFGFWTCPSGFTGQTLKVYNWTTYIAEDTISNFEELCGVTVIYDTYASDSDMQAVIEQGNSPGYDIVIPTDSTVYVMAAAGLFKTLDQSSITNMDNVTSQFLNPPYDPGNLYTLPYQWGTIGIGYNRTKVGRDITSWEDVFNYEGPVAWLDDERAMLGVALRLLGYDPNTTAASEVERASQYLIDHAANMTVIAPDDGQDRLANDEVDIVVEYSGDIFQVISDCNCDDFAYVIPSEGARVWVDSLAIPETAPHPELAEVFIDYILDPQVGADISNFTAYASPNQVAIDYGLIEQEYLTNSAIYPDASVSSSLFYVISSPELASIFAEQWLALKTTLQRSV